jgi:hypothetical protein
LKRKTKPKEREAQNAPISVTPEFGLKIRYPIPATIVGASATPHSDPLLDIVFVHGLGGSATGTWTYPGSDSFWPLWLPEETGLQNVRILTFSYNANWNPITGGRTVLDIAGFAGQLLDAMELHYHKNGEVQMDSFDVDF